MRLWIETTAWNDRHSIIMNEEQLELIKRNSSIQVHELSAIEKQEWIKELYPVYEVLSTKIGHKLVEDIKELGATFSRSGLNGN